MLCFYAVSAGIDHGVKVKTKRRKNSARHERHEDKIKIWNYHTLRSKKKPGRGYVSGFIKLFRHPAALPLPGFTE
jgi:hypothetical protein